MKILILNGPNLNMLGVRDPEIYGDKTLQELDAALMAYGKLKGVRVDCFQSNHEGVLVDMIQSAHDLYDGVILNPAAYTHYSYAIRDAVETISAPVVEVHLSDISQREDFRRVSVIAPVCIGQIMGRGQQGYVDALDLLISHVKGKK